MFRTIFLIYLFFAPILLLAQPIAPNLMTREKNPNKDYPIFVEYPHEGTRIWSGAKGIFMFGKVKSGGLLYINETQIDIYKTGTFLAYMPVKTGINTFVFEYRDGENTYKVKRSVKVLGEPLSEYEKKPKLSESSAFPAKDWEVSTEDELTFSVFATPYKKVIFNLGSLKDIEMQEDPLNPGNYSKTIKLNESNELKKPQIVEYRLLEYNGKYLGRALSQGKIRISKPEDLLRVARVRGQNLRTRPAPNSSSGHNLEQRLFNKVQIFGEQNGFYRVLLDKKPSFIESALLTPQENLTLPRNIAWEIATQEKENSTLIIIKNTDKVSFSTKQTDQTFSIILYNTQALNTIMTDPHDKLISSLDYEIVSDKAKKITARYKNGKKLWGFKNYYDDNNLVFELFHEPNFNFTEDKPLKTLKIVLDPGHSPKRKIPYDGAVGPSGLLEYEVNYQIALSAKEQLESYGAEVFLSKTPQEMTSLYDRPAKVEEHKAHLFLSIHNNALPDHINPLTRELGFSFYYYYQQSVPLAKAMEKSFIKTIGLPDNGVIQADFAVTRSLPQTPAILIENAYMMVPWQEELLKHQRFIDMLGKSIAEGVIYFVNPKWAKKNLPVNMEASHRKLEDTLLKENEINYQEKL